MSARPVAALAVLVAAVTLSACPPPVDNPCGGGAAVARDQAVPADATVGSACGACGDGVAVCAGPDLIVCSQATPANVCGGCGGEALELGATCGRCGAVAACDGDQVACVEGGTVNACGGCERLDAEPGGLCVADDVRGVYRCTATAEVSCILPGQNTCGGETPLPALAGERCGVCGQGVFVCEGADALTCNGADDGLNACGGCLPLEGLPGTACGGCGGTWICTDDGERVACDEPAPNACGGCASLAFPPGATCEGGGVAVCTSPESVGCGPAGSNLCGGAAPLDDEVGSACGTCDDGVVVCASPSATTCAGAGEVNLCGGCGFVPDLEGEACAPRGQWACEAGALVCALDDNANACGGSATLDNTPFAPCGTCDRGSWQCDGFDALACVGGEDAASFAWPDADGDGHGDAAAAPVVQCTLAEGFARSGDDCDDERPDAHPGADEVCNGEDDDCDDSIDEEAVDATRWYVDADGDGFGAPGGQRACAAPPGTVSAGGDCNDDDDRFYPEAPEDDCADPADYNCDGERFPDEDGDGYGACVDCDDDPNRHPGVLERCDGVDNNCDGETDEGSAIDAPLWFVDGDGDGYGDALTPIKRCSQPAGRIALGGDCDDDNSDIHPGADERCDDVDNDCDEIIDPVTAVDAPTWTFDDDEDGFGDDSIAVVQCDQPPGFVLVGGDCNDDSPAIHPHTAAAPVQERCDFLDNDCDGQIDNADAVAPGEWFEDLDGDGYGVTSTLLLACIPDVPGAAPAGHVLVGGDCNDDSPNIRPGAEEIIGDEVDQDCDTEELCYVDGDGDGYLDEALGVVVSTDLSCDPLDGEGTLDAALGDCDDGAPLVNPGQPEVIGNGSDDNCDGYELCYADRDSDGFRSADGQVVLTTAATCPVAEGYALDSAPGDDCDDDDDTVHPGAADPLSDREDRDCNGFEWQEGEPVRFVSEAGVDVPGCGALGAPCRTPGFDAGTGFDGGLFMIETGVYPTGPKVYCQPSAYVGGFCPGSGFTATDCGGDITTLQATSTGTLIRGDGGDCTVGNGGIAQLELAHLEVRGADAPAGAGTFGPSTTLIGISYAALTLNQVRIVAGRGGDSTTLHGGRSVAIELYRYPFGVDPTAAVPSLTLRDSEIVLGRGGDAAPGSAGEGGAAVGILLRDQGLVDVQGLTITVDDALGAGQPGGAAAPPCTDTALGTNCHWRTASAGRRFTYLEAEGSGTWEQFSRVVDGQVRHYALVRTPTDGLGAITSTCAGLGMTAVVFDDVGEQEAIARRVAGLLDQPSGAFKVGLIDELHEGVFVWANGAPLTGSLWAPGEPAAGVNDRGTMLGNDGLLRSRNGAGPFEAPALCEGPEALNCTSDNDCGGGFCCPGALSGYLACFEETCHSAMEVRSPDGVNVTPYVLSASGDMDATEASCEAVGLELTTLNDAAETSELASFLVQQSVGEAWTGYRNLTPDDVFAWEQAPGLSSIPWAPGHPADVGRGRLLSVTFYAVLGPTPDDATLTTTSWVAADAYDLDIPLVCGRN